MMFELLLKVWTCLRDSDAEYAIARCQAKFRRFGIFDGSKPMILPLSIERPSPRPIS
jgi:hypothetical protein